MCSKAALYTVMVGLLAVAVASGSLLILDSEVIPEDSPLFGLLFLIGVSVAVFGHWAIHRSGFMLGEEGLSVSRPFSRHWIDYSSIERVERVCRKGTMKSEKVRLSFVELGKEKYVEITPADPALLVYDLLRKCPQIARTKCSKVKRNGSFRTAKESMVSPRRRMPPVEF